VLRSLKDKLRFKFNVAVADWIIRMSGSGRWSASSPSSTEEKHVREVFAESPG